MFYISTIYIFIPVSSCVDRAPMHCFDREVGGGGVEGMGYNAETDMPRPPRASLLTAMNIKN